MPRTNHTSDRSDTRTSKRRRLNDNDGESPLETSILAQGHYRHADLPIAGEGEGQFLYKAHVRMSESHDEELAVNLAAAASLECCFGMVGSYVNGAVRSY